VKRVLIVNDEEDLAEVCRLVLERRGMDVHTRVSAGGLREVLLKLRPDLVVLDWIIGDTTADRVLPEVRATTPTAPVLVMSATPGLEATARSLGAASFLGKPFDAARFTREVDRLLEWAATPRRLMRRESRCRTRVALS
jgi:DNA-binding NtrC family response regulator